MTFPTEDREPSEWPFDEPPNVAVILDATVMNGLDWIAMAARDEEDGGWQFVGSRARRDGGLLSDDLAKVVSLANVRALEPTITAMSKLPMGHMAVRDTPTSEWRTRKRATTVE